MAVFVLTLQRQRLIQSANGSSKALQNRRQENIENGNIPVGNQEEENEQDSLTPFSVPGKAYFLDICSTEREDNLNAKHWVVRKTTYVGREEEGDWFDCLKDGFADSKTGLEAGWLKADLRIVFSSHHRQPWQKC